MLPRFLRPRPPAFAALPRPDPPVCVVGDVHGEAGLLAAMLERIAARGPARLILAGDLIDRGPDSAAVLARVQALAESGAAVALMGNHERMALDFLDDPVGAGPLWLGNGGDATLASFGLNPWAPRHPADLARALREALPPGQEAWLRALPLCWRAGDLAVSHAGGDPALPLEDQPAEALLWGHRDFFRKPRTDGLWMAHGHVIQPGVRAEAGRIGTDTGAFATGRLSAAWLDARGLEVLEVRHG